MKDHRWLPVAVFSVAIAAGCASHAPVPVVDRSVSATTVPAGGSGAPGATYMVKRGDTLYSIALDHGVDYRELAAWNDIENPNRIQVGQQLRVKPPGAVQAEGAAQTQPVVAAVVAPIEQRPLDSSPAPAATKSMLKSEPRAGKLPYSEETLAMAQRSAQEGAAKPAEPLPPVAPKTVEPPRQAGPAETVAETAESSVGPDGVPWMWPASGKLVGQFSDSGSKGIAIAGKAGDAVVSAGDGRVVYAGSGLRGYGKLLIVKHNATFLSAYAHNQSLLVKEGQAVKRGQKIAEMGDTDSDQVKLHFEIRQQGKPVDPLKHLPKR